MILVVIEILLALKKLYDLLHKNERVKLFAEAPDNDDGALRWEVIDGKEGE